MQIRLPISLLLLLAIAATSRGQESVWRDTSRTFTMKATYYADNFVGRKTTSGEVFSQEGYTAAHHGFPLHTLLLVTNMKTGSQVIVKVNDRCPKRGVLDLSRRAAETIDITHRNGVAPVTVRIMGEEYLDFWQQQGEIREVMSAGAELTGSREVKKAKSKAAMAGTKPKPAATDSSAAANSVKSIAEADHDCWMVVLCVITSQYETNQSVAKLPIYHQENVAIVADADNRQLLLTLDVRQNQKLAEKTRKEVSGLFPDSYLMKCPR
ncbi:MAG: septal ring lytic transglycosylase RlpA family protein [Bacteroidales bacterium]|nr:septal ring lytic transglycosylase RlpA family protein [Bacteroidales bacterium]